MMIFRLILGVLLLFVIIQGWWFIALPIALIGLLRYRWYFESLVAGIVYDSLFGLIDGEGARGRIGIIAASVIFIGMVLLKNILRK